MGELGFRPLTRPARGPYPLAQPGVAPREVGSEPHFLPPRGTHRGGSRRPLSPAHGARHVVGALPSAGANAPPAATFRRAAGNAEGRPWPLRPGSCAHSPLARNPHPPPPPARFRAGPAWRLLKRRNVPKWFFESLAWRVLQRPEVTLAAEGVLRGVSSGRAQPHTDTHAQRTPVPPAGAACALPGLPASVCFYT